MSADAAVGAKHRDPARIGVGIVGNGMATRVFHVPYITACADFELRAVVSRRHDAAPPAPGVALVGDIETLLADPAISLVIIATPSAHHVDLAARALAAGKNVVVEKPLALDPASARDLFARAQEAGRFVTAFHNRRWDADFLGIRAALEAGEIGRVVQFESHFDRFRPHVRDRWREDGSEGSGIWFDLGPHLLDQALLLFGRPEAVSADITTLRTGGLAPDYAHVVLHYPGMRAILHASMSVAGGEPRFRVHGTKGSLVKEGLDPQEAQLVAGLRPGDAGWGCDPAPLVWFDGEDGREERALPAGCQHSFYSRLAAACRGAAALPVLPHEVLLVQDVIAAAQRSDAEGRRIPL